MILKTEMFKAGVTWLSKVKANRVFQGLVLIYREGNNLIGEIPGSSSCYKVVLADNMIEDIEFGIIVDKLLGAIQGHAEDTFELDLRANCVYIKSNTEATLAIYGAKGDLNKIPSWSNQDQLGTASLDINSLSGLLTEYLKGVLADDEMFKEVYIKDVILSFDRKCLRVAKHGLDIPYPIFLDSTNFKIIQELAKLDGGRLDVYLFAKQYEFSNNSGSVMLFRQSQKESVFDKDIRTLLQDCPHETQFSFNKEEMKNMAKDFKYFLKNSFDCAVLDLVGNQVLIETEDDQVKTPMIMDASKGMSPKKINLINFIKVLEYCEDDVTVYTGLEPRDYLHLENGVENIIFTPVG